MDEAGDEGEHQRVEARGAVALAGHVRIEVEQDGRADAGGHQREEEAQPVNVVMQRDVRAPGSSTTSIAPLGRQ